MKKKNCLFLALLLAPFLLSYPIIGCSYPPSSQRNLKTLRLEGSPYERGINHGKSLKKDIHTLVNLWKSDIEERYKIEPDLFIKKFLEYTDFTSAIERWTPGLLDEVRGIAEGSGIDFDTIFAFQLVDEMWVLGAEVLGNESERIDDHCTTIGRRKSRLGPSIISQTLDIPTFYHGFQTLLHIKEPDSDLQAMLFTFPGFIAANGMNSASLAVVVNAVQQLEHSRDGLPVAYVIRGILQKKTYEEALKFIHTVRFGAPQNYMIGGPEKVGSFECSATHVEEFSPFPGALFTYHTNHPLRNKQFTPQIQNAFKSQNIDPQNYTFKCQRFEALQRMLKDNDVDIDIEKLKNIYSSRETRINNRGTFGATIMVLTESPELHISPGRPDETPYQVFRFDESHSIQH